MYADFRPEVSGWGGRGEVRCSKILGLRRKEGPAQSEANKVEVPVKIEEDGNVDAAAEAVKEDGDSEPEAKRSRTMTLEEYEAMLDADDTYADVDLGFPEPQTQLPPKTEDGD